MPRITYLENKFDKELSDPLTPNEYNLLKYQYNTFIKSTEEKLNTKRNSDLKKFYPYKTRLYILSFFFILNLIFDKFIKFDYPEPTLILIIEYLFYFIVINNIMYFYSYLKSFWGLGEYLREIKHYYKYHKKHIEKSTNYDDYLIKLKK